jgi:hypothetical protein
MASINDTLRTSLIADAVASLDRLEVLDGSSNVLVTFTITWSAGSAGVQAVASTPVSGTAGAAGTAAAARLYNNAGSPDEQITGLTVGTSGTDVTIDNTSISNGQTVNLTSLSLTMPAALS